MPTKDDVINQIILGTYASSGTTVGELLNQNGAIYARDAAGAFALGENRLSGPGLKSF